MIASRTALMESSIIIRGFPNAQSSDRGNIRLQSVA
jgi:hypothetical protein